MSLPPQRLAIIGCGTLGTALLRGLLARSSSNLAHVHLTARTVKRLEDFASVVGASPTIEVSADNVRAAQQSEIVVFAVKPQSLHALLENEALAQALDGKLVVSVAAGVRIHQLQSLLPNSRIVRAMPNTPALIGEGMTVLAPGSMASETDLAVVRELFAAVGRTLVLEESHMDVVTSLNGSGPAFVYMLLEAMVDGGVMMGLPRATAMEIAAQVFRGASTMVLETKQHPAALRDQVTTPAGCTIAGLLAMEDGRVRSVVARAIQEASQVASTLGVEKASR